MRESGQTLIEVLIGLLITGIVVGALVIATVVGLRNAQFSQIQSQATQRAQQGLEIVRTIRDRDGQVSFNYGENDGWESGFVSDSNEISNFSGLFTIPLSDKCINGKCYFLLNPQIPSLTNTTAVDLEDLGSGLTRQVVIEDTGLDFNKEKKITVYVYWTDTTGQHESNLQTILGKK